MQLHKFLDIQVMDIVRQGSFRFGSAKYYRLLEMVYDDEWIGDKNEATNILKITDNTYDTDKNPNAVKSLEALGFKIENSHNIRIQNLVQRKYLHCYILSFSCGNYSELKEKMSGSKAGFEYTGCLSIQNPEKLAQNIIDTGVVSCSLGDNISIRDVTDKLYSAPVVYTTNETEFDHQSLPPPQFQIKHPKYMDQAEYRFVIIPKQKLEDDALIVECDMEGVEYTSREIDIPSMSSENYNSSAQETVCDAIEYLFLIAVQTSTHFLNLMATPDQRSKIPSINIKCKNLKILSVDLKKIIKCYWIVRQEFGPVREAEEMILGESLSNNFFVGVALDYIFKQYRAEINEKYPNLFDSLYDKIKFRY